ncbi:hypothetical protein M2271_005100 [Streptomyces sp. LBL]|nr:hypothetical protein [Streptomyces sp. LBL]
MTIPAPPPSLAETRSPAPSLLNELPWGRWPRRKCLPRWPSGCRRGAGRAAACGAASGERGRGRGPVGGLSGGEGRQRSRCRLISEPLQTSAWTASRGAPVVSPVNKATCVSMASRRRSLPTGPLPAPPPSDARTRLPSRDGRPLRSLGAHHRRRRPLHHGLSPARNRAPPRRNTPSGTSPAPPQQRDSARRRCARGVVRRDRSRPQAGHLAAVGPVRRGHGGAPRRVRRIRRSRKAPRGRRSP